MSFYKLELPETRWQVPEDEDERFTFYRENEDGSVDVLNFENEWQKSMFENIPQIRSFYTDGSSVPWPFSEVQESEVPVATED